MFFYIPDDKCNKNFLLYSKIIPAIYYINDYAAKEDDGKKVLFKSLSDCIGHGIYTALNTAGC